MKLEKFVYNPANDAVQNAIDTVTMHLLAYAKTYELLHKQIWRKAPHRIKRYTFDGYPTHQGRPVEFISSWDIKSWSYAPYAYDAPNYHGNDASEDPLFGLNQLFSGAEQDFRKPFVGDIKESIYHDDCFIQPKETPFTGKYMSYVFGYWTLGDNNEYVFLQEVNNTGVEGVALYKNVEVERESDTVSQWRLKKTLADGTIEYTAWTEIDASVLFITKEYGAHNDFAFQIPNFQSMPDWYANMDEFPHGEGKKIVYVLEEKLSDGSLFVKSFGIDKYTSGRKLHDKFIIYNVDLENNRCRQITTWYEDNDLHTMHTSDVEVTFSDLTEDIYVLELTIEQAQARHPTMFNASDPFWNWSSVTLPSPIHKEVLYYQESDVINVPYLLELVGKSATIIPRGYSRGWIKIYQDGTAVEFVPAYTENWGDGAYIEHPACYKRLIMVYSDTGDLAMSRVEFVEKWADYFELIVREDTEWWEGFIKPIMAIITVVIAVYTRIVLNPIGAVGTALSVVGTLGGNKTLGLIGSVLMLGAGAYNAIENSFVQQGLDAGLMVNGEMISGGASLGTMFESYISNVGFSNLLTIGPKVYGLYNQFTALGVEAPIEEETQESETRNSLVFVRGDEESNYDPERIIRL